MIDCKEKISVLFVCMGNICRSPTAEGVFRQFVTDAGLADRIEVDSAGTHAYHVGEPADRRSAAAAAERGYSLDGIAARRVSATDFERFDYILAMDEDNLRRLQDQAPENYAGTLGLFLEQAGGQEASVPDPYYGGAAGFAHVLDLIEEASQALIDRLSKAPA